MGEIAIYNPWLPQDDILLKNSIEAGASLESLARGAVEFSRKFTIKELQDRWRSLLYDPSVSLEACARMAECELSSVQSKSKKVDITKESKLVHGKRKQQSIRSCYYAMRKRVCHDPCYQGDLNFMDNSFVNAAGDDVIEDPLAIDFGLQDCNFDILCNVPDLPLGNEYFIGQQNILEGPMDQNKMTPGPISQKIGNPNMTGQTCPSEELYGHGTFEANNIGVASWKTVENMLLSRTPDDVITGNNVHTMDRFDITDNNDVGEGILEDEDIHFLTNGMSFDGFQPSTGSPDDYLADIADFKFTNEVETLLNEDKNDEVDDTSHGELEALLLDTLDIDDEVCNMPENNPVSVMPSCFHSGIIPVKGDVAETYMGESNSQSSFINQASTSAPNVDPRCQEYHDEAFSCVLNTEDPEIPCNDPIIVPSKKSAHGHKKAQKKVTIPSSSGKGITGTQAIEKVNKPHTTQSLEVGLNFAVNGHGVETETQGRGGLCQKSMTIKKEYSDLPRFDVGQNADSSHVPKFSASILEEADEEYVSSENEEQKFDSDDDIPYFSDVESMVLDMDLGPLDQGDVNATIGAKYLQEGFMKEIIRLEQNAHSYMQRDMELRGAFAVLFGRNSKHYIKKPEVLLGRATDGVNVDIDLTRIGDDNKISRRQVCIKMDSDGTFSLRNLGKCPVYVNGEEITHGQLLDLDSNSLIEIRGMPFMFEVNQHRVKLFLDKP